MRSALSARRTTVVAAVVLCFAGFLSAAGFAAAASGSSAAGRPAALTAAHSTAPRPLATLPHSAGHIAQSHAAAHHLPAGQAYACAKPKHFGQMQCMAVIKTSAHTRTRVFSSASPAAGIPGYSPASLRSAYKLNSFVGRGRGETVAIVDAFRDPNAAADLAKYRSHYHLPRCTTASRCLRIVNQQGAARPLPAANRNWAVEESLDLDMVSAICPHCRILLIEARNNNTPNLGAAENTAVRMGAKFVSNSWSGFEGVGETSLDHYFNHPGVVIDFAAGDFGYAPAYPTDSQYVTAVGGTSLRHAKNGRGWSETAWSGTGSGCATFLAKPSWQQAIDNTAPDGCLNRIGNDVSADANPATGVAVYDSYRFSHAWQEVGGTSVATPLVTAVYALAGNPAARTYPSSYLYKHTSSFFDVKSGHNGTCETFRAYLCHGVSGYDAPTGLGTPNGIAGFSRASAPGVTLVDPGTKDIAAGGFTVKITGVDAAAKPAASCKAVSVPSLQPSQLTASPVAGTANCVLNGNLPASTSPYQVTVTVTDTAGKSGQVSFMIVAVGSMTGASTTGQIKGLFSNLCLNSEAGTAGAAVRSTACGASSTQDWTLQAGAGPGSAGQILGNGLCLGLNSSGRGVLATCSSSTRWQFLGFGLFQNASTGKCLNDTTSGAQVGQISCANLHGDVFSTPAGQITSGVNGLCLDNPSNAQAMADTCGTSTDNWLQPANNAELRSSANGLCADVDNNLDNTSVTVFTTCNKNSGTQAWFWAPGGELVNAASGLCLADPSGTPASGDSLELEDCYGLPGEIWAFN